MKAKARVFWLHFNRFGAKRGSRDAWTVRVGGRNLHAPGVSCRVPLVTVYRGDSAPQPRAYLWGKGVVSRRRGYLLIEGA